MAESHNARIKGFFDKENGFVPYELMAFSFPVFGSGKEVKSNKCSYSEMSEHCSDRDFENESRRRAIARCRDLGMCNSDLSLFATFTLDKKRIDTRYEYDVVVKKMNTWLDNRVRRNGLKYLIVPELHKDGAIHFHGLLNDVLERHNSGVKFHRKVVYNLPDWSFGFSTAQRISGENCVDKVTEYVLKYITKGDKKVGGRYYLHGGDFKEPETFCFDLALDRFPGKEFTVADGLAGKICRSRSTISELLPDLLSDHYSLAHFCASAKMQGELLNEE